MGQPEVLDEIERKTQKWKGAEFIETFIYMYIFVDT